jgi:hypothetical protein
MTMRIWPWSVIADLRAKVETTEKKLSINAHVQDLLHAIIKQQLAAINAGLGRVLAKIDPIYGMAEDDPRRIADSKQLEEEIIKKLQAEQAVLQSRNLVP